MRGAVPISVAAMLSCVGPGVSPKIALSVGLKVDMTAVLADVASGIKAGTVKWPRRTTLTEP